MSNRLKNTADKLIDKNEKKELNKRFEIAVKNATDTSNNLMRGNSATADWIKRQDFEAKRNDAFKGIRG